MLNRHGRWGNREAPSPANACPLSLPPQMFDVHYHEQYSMFIMRSEQRSITLNVYLESSRLHEPEAQANICTESLMSKLTFHHVTNPEWAAHALSRVMYVHKVIDFGSSKADPAQYGVTVIYRHEQVSDISKFSTMVRMVIENTGLTIPHL